MQASQAEPNYDLGVKSDSDETKRPGLHKMTPLFNP